MNSCNTGKSSVLSGAKAIASALLIGGTILMSAPQSSVAATIAYDGNLTAVTGVTTTGRGEIDLLFDDVANTLRISVNFEDLASNSLFSHLHCCTSTIAGGTAGPASIEIPGFPVGARAGSVIATLDLSLASSFSSAFLAANGSVSAAAAALIQALNTSRAYFNVHTEGAPAGEISGFLFLDKSPPAPDGGGGATDVPVPAALPLLASALGFLGWRSRRRQAA